ncbi:zinc-binding dehydrogenase [Hirsutella rhossiliensis]|uniref:Zinc-binding dehydrogenase domain-containing protein n=1 Tax=Hirsutella rhossiliensis TaxID=111463 RepID=A0A9P8N686_9HYPO|nr:zinc-binding dehydrogenase domain-containing protein [Hirsutella rhossiliensis]KAH0966539.1 zinc-binding dehydrogenase domain-containing protein [Hirsutella rhossiliensis]
MKAVQITGSKGSHQITLTHSLPAPTAQGRDILIKVCAAGITADEVTWPELYDSSNRVPGHDVSGIVEAVGPEYDGPAVVGDGVFAMLGTSTDQGSQADYAVVLPDEIAPKPASLSHAQAAALPIPILTAWEAIFQHAELASGSKVLVTGASGAVGVMLVQLASRLLGAHVTGLAAASNHAYVRDLGASHVLDYNSPDWESAVSEMDAVFDTVGGQTLAKSWNTVKKNGVVVTVADPPPPWALGKEEPEELRRYPDVRKVYFVVTSQGSTLSKVAALLEKGDVKPLPVKVFPAEDALAAWAYARKRGREGKAVIEFLAGD